MKKKSIIFSLIAIGLLLLVMPMPGVNQQECLDVWLEFGSLIKQSDYTAAHSMLTESARARWTTNDLTPSANLAFPGSLDSPVIRYRSSFLLGRTTFLATHSKLRLPLCLEDGIWVAEVNMKKEDGEWKLELPKVHMR